MSDAWPDHAAAASLYLRLRTADPLAPSDFAETYLEPLAGFLRAVDPRADDHSRLTAAGDAILSVIRNPLVYDSDRGELADFLKMAARRDLLNVLGKERRHRLHHEYRDPVELPESDGNDSETTDDLPSFGDADFALIIATFTDVESKVFELLRGGEKRTEVFAGEMGIADLPIDEQRREVKRVKDRIIVRLKRAREKT